MPGTRGHTDDSERLWGGAYLALALVLASTVKRVAPFETVHVKTKPPCTSPCVFIDQSKYGSLWGQMCARGFTGTR